MVLTWKGYVGGSFAICVVVITWQLQAELLQGLSETSSPNYYDKPYFLVWFISMGYGVFVPVWFVIRLYSLLREYSWKHIFTHPQSLLRREDYWVIAVASVSSFPYFICGYFWYLSISHTSVTANTAIYDSSFVFVFLFSMFLLHERISLLKTMSVFVSFVGLMIIVWAGSQSYESGVDQTVMGYILVTLSTILYAVYEVVYKKYATPPGQKKNQKNQEGEDLSDGAGVVELKINEEDPVKSEDTEKDDSIPFESNFLFLGTIGVVTGIGYWPGMILLNYIGFEIFEWPDWGVMRLLLLNISFDSTNNIALLLGISWSSPLFMSIGNLLNIPVSIILDIIIHSYLLPTFGFVGIACIVIGFALLIIADKLIEISLRPVNKQEEILLTSEEEMLQRKNCFRSLVFWSWRWR